MNFAYGYPSKLETVDAKKGERIGMTLCMSRVFSHDHKSTGLLKPEDETNLSDEEVRKIIVSIQIVSASDLSERFLPPLLSVRHERLKQASERANG